MTAVRRLAKPSAHTSAELPRRKWTMIVRFRDPMDPRTVEMVDPAFFGVQRMTVETTTDPVSNTIRSRLPWLTDRGKRRALDGKAFATTESPLYVKLGQGMFKAGRW